MSSADEKKKEMGGHQKLKLLHGDACRMNWLICQAGGRQMIYKDSADAWPGKGNARTAIYWIAGIHEVMLFAK